jgi:WXG100 family type VII secretion target
MRIQVHPESLREVARTFNRQSAAIQEIEEELCRAIGGLDTWAWDGHSRARAEPLLGRVGPEGRHLAGQLEELGRKLQHVAEEFERTDAIVADPLTPVFEGLSQWTEQASAFFEQFENLKTWFAVPLVAGLMVPGMTYAGQIKLYGPQWLKEWAGISSHLTHIKASNIPKHMAKSALHIGPLDVLFEAGSELDENWKEYKGDLRKAAVGVAVDTAIGVGITTLAGAGGAYIGAVIGQILIPIPGAGALIGGTLGRIAGTWLGGQLAEKAENIRLGDQELDQWLVEFIAK